MGREEDRSNERVIEKVERHKDSKITSTPLHNNTNHRKVSSCILFESYQYCCNSMTIGQLGNVPILDRISYNAIITAQEESWSKFKAVVSEIRSNQIANS